MFMKTKSIFLRPIHKIFNRLNSSNPFLKRRFSEHEKLISDIELRISNAEKKIHEIDYELQAAPYIEDEENLLSFFASNGSRIGFKSDSNNNFAYADFENLFRGSENFIFDRMKFYQRFFSPNQKVLDVGCGRGELIKVLLEAGINVSGIEPDESMFQIAQKSQLSVEKLTWEEKYEKSENLNLDGIISIQVIEHLNPNKFFDFVEKSQKLLKPGGKLIIETINPHSPAALKTFWLDLTHTRPIFPESLIDLGIRANFSSGYVLFPYGIGEWEHDLRHAGEYSVILQK